MKNDRRMTFYYFLTIGIFLSLELRAQGLNPSNRICHNIFSLSGRSQIQSETVDPPSLPQFSPHYEPKPSPIMQLQMMKNTQDHTVTVKYIKALVKKVEEFDYQSSLQSVEELNTISQMYNLHIRFEKYVPGQHHHSRFVEQFQKNVEVLLRAVARQYRHLQKPDTLRHDLARNYFSTVPVHPESPFPINLLPESFRSYLPQILREFSWEKSHWKDWWQSGERVWVGQRKLVENVEEPWNARQEAQLIYHEKSQTFDFIMVSPDKLSELYSQMRRVLWALLKHEMYSELKSQQLPTLVVNEQGELILKNLPMTRRSLRLLQTIDLTQNYAYFSQPLVIQGDKKWALVKEFLRKHFEVEGQIKGFELRALFKESSSTP